MQKAVCPLCGGDGYVSADTAHTFGRQEGDTTCPSCDGQGRVLYRPLPTGPHWSLASQAGQWLCYDYEGYCMVAHKIDDPRGKYRVRLYADADEFTVYANDLKGAFTELKAMHQEGKK